MGLTTLTLPRLGETMEEARVTEWLKQPGDAFRRGEVLLEVETDKTVVEVPALGDGTLVAHLVAPGDTVALDQPIAEVEVAGSVAAGPPEAARGPVQAAPPEKAAPVPPAPEAPDRIRASPNARRVARLAGIGLSRIEGNGRNGRIAGSDVQAHAAAPANDDGVATSRGLIAVRREGDGAATPIVLLHGLYDHGRGWRDLPARLARAGHAVLVPDLPGHGASAAGAADPAEAAGIMAEALAALRPEGALRLVGHSLGAVIAAHLAAGLGSRCESLMLIAPAGLGPRLNADFTDLMAQAETPAALARALTLLGAGPLSDVMLAAELDRLRAQRGATAALARSVVRNGIQQIDIAPVLARLGVPVTAIFGTGDRIVDWRDCAALPPRAAIHLLRDAGHLPHVALPDLVADLILGRTDREGAQARQAG